jgi:hypothetical protein
MSRLEAENRRLKRRLAAAMTVAVAGFLYLFFASSHLGSEPRAWAQTTRESSETMSGTVTMEHLILVDQKGRKRIELDALDKKGPGLVLYDEAEHCRARLQLINGDTPWLQFLNGNDGEIAHLACLRTEAGLMEGNLTICGPAEGGSCMYVRPTRFEMAAGEKARVVLSLRGQIPLLALLGKDAAVRANTAFEDDGTAGLRVVDKTGQTTWRTP